MPLQQQSDPQSYTPILCGRSVNKMYPFTITRGSNWKAIDLTSTYPAPVYNTKVDRKSLMTLRPGMETVWLQSNRGLLTNVSPNVQVNHLLATIKDRSHPDIQRKLESMQLSLLGELPGSNRVFTELAEYIDANYRKSDSRVNIDLNKALDAAPLNMEDANPVDEILRIFAQNMTDLANPLVQEKWQETIRDQLKNKIPGYLSISLPYTWPDIKDFLTQQWTELRSRARASNKESSQENLILLAGQDKLSQDINQLNRQNVALSKHVGNLAAYLVK